MAWTDFQSKAEIMVELRSMDPVAADAARYLADLVLENQDRLGDAEAVSAMACAAMLKALDEANLRGGTSNLDLILLAGEHGKQIGEMALAMAVFVAGKSRKGWIAGAVAVTLAVAIAALGS